MLSLSEPNKVILVSKKRGIKLGKPEEWMSFIDGLIDYIKKLSTICLRRNKKGLNLIPVHEEIEMVGLNDGVISFNLL